MAEYMDLSSESDSDSEMDACLLLYLGSRKKSFWKSNYMDDRESIGQFAATKKYSDVRFKNYYRLNRQQFDEVHELIKNSIFSEGCNAQKPIGTDEKLAVFLR